MYKVPNPQRGCVRKDPTGTAPCTCQQAGGATTSPPQKSSFPVTLRFLGTPAPPPKNPQEVTDSEAVPQGQPKTTDLPVCPAGEVEGGTRNTAKGGTLNPAVRLSYHDVAHGAALALAIGGDNDVDVLYDALEGLVELLRLQLQLKQGPVHLVHHQHRLDALSNGLAQHRLCLHTHTCRPARDDAALAAREWTTPDSKSS